MVPWLNRLSVTVGMAVFLSGDNVPTVKSTGPILGNEESARIQTDGPLRSPEDSVDTIEAAGIRGNAYGLLGNNEPRGNRHRVRVLGS